MGLEKLTNERFVYSSALLSEIIRLLIKLCTCFTATGLLGSTRQVYVGFRVKKKSEKRIMKVVVAVVPSYRCGPLHSRKCLFRVIPHCGRKGDEDEDHQSDDDGEGDKLADDRVFDAILGPLAVPVAELGFDGGSAKLVIYQTAQSDAVAEQL